MRFEQYHEPAIDFFFQCYGDHRILHSFPTRRSSDLYFSRSAIASFMDSTLVCRKSGVLSQDRKSTRLNSSHVAISYAVFCLKKKKPFWDKQHARWLEEYEIPVARKAVRDVDHRKRKI